MPDEAGISYSPHAWDGTTYYDREQVKAAPFNNWLVGSYIFMSGLSGGAALLAALLDTTRGRQARRVVRRGRLISLLAPTIGTACLLGDLHTPQRFYNMLRLFKTTSPMSIGSWILSGFGGISILTAVADLLGGRRVARVAQVPAAFAGAGLGTYMASLLSATSTPLWAAAPRATAIRFASSSVAAAAAALSLGQRRSRTARDLDRIAVAALALELAATVSADETYHRAQIPAAMKTPPGMAEELGATILGTLLPLVLYLVSSAARKHRSPAVSAAASLATLAGSAILRIAFLAAGDESARRPDISLRFTQPDNLRRSRGWRIGHRD